MKTRNLILTALTALTLTALAGCSTETELPQDALDLTVPDGMARIEFAIKGVKTGISYAGSVGLDPAESKINDVTAYLFKLADGETSPAANTPLSAVVTATVKEAGAVGNFVMPTNDTDTRYGIVFVVNKACYNAALANVTTANNATYATLNAIETLSNTDIMTNLATRSLPMHSLRTNVVIPADGGTVNIGDLLFARPLSRFDIDNQAVHSFTITSVVLKNARTTSPLNAPATAGEVTVGALKDIAYPTFISDVNEKLTDANPDGTNTKLRPAFYAAPGLGADGSSLIVKGKLRLGLDLIDREYIVPLVNKVDGTEITLGFNKRYRLTMKMDKGNDVIGEITLDLGSWDDADGDPNFSQDMNCLPIASSIDIEAIYTESVHTFEVPFGTTAFEFNMLNALPDVTPTMTGVVKNVESNPATLGVTALRYKVTVDGLTSGKGTFAFEKDGKTCTFTVVVLPRVTYTVNGTEVDAVFVSGISTINLNAINPVYWAPVNLGATTAEEPGSLYQFGRMKGWADGATALAAQSTDKIFIADSETGGNDAKFIHLNMGSWWKDTDQVSIRALVARWTAVSDGTSNPCPMGWRLPKKSDFSYIMGEREHKPVFSEVGGGVYKATTVGITLAGKEAIAEGSIIAGTSYYWASDYLMRLDSDKYDLPYIQSESNSSWGAYIRCVKDKAPLN